MKTLQVHWRVEQEVEVGLNVVEPGQTEIPRTTELSVMKPAKLIVITKHGAVLHQCIHAA
jgi:hypothetical protein